MSEDEYDVLAQRLGALERGLDKGASDALPLTLGDDRNWREAERTIASPVSFHLHSAEKDVTDNAAVLLRY